MMMIFIRIMMNEFAKFSFFKIDHHTYPVHTVHAVFLYILYMHVHTIFLHMQFTGTFRIAIDYHTYAMLMSLFTPYWHIYIVDP